MAAVAPKQGRPRRKLSWWLLHQWAGLKLGLLLTFVFVTGTLATVSSEIDWLLRPAMRVVPQSGPAASPVRWLAAAEALPGFAVQEVHAPMHARDAAQLHGIDRHGQEVIAYVHPWSGRLQGIGPALTVQHVLRDLHRALMLPTDLGVTLVSLLCLPLLATLVTAFKVYKKWWRGFARWPRVADAPASDSPRIRAAHRRRWHGDMHRLTGAWSLPFIALITLTSAWYLAEKLGGAAPEQDAPAVPQAASAMPRRRS